jgi:hypothetical protein|uniref:Uncharacterized protein n=1 Tax=Podoviridae sp. ctiuS14 TaxID=2827620 RepID=A0A8S5LLZ3_9CAUD|nr:MAG TPA: hypothetical protein [Podoviridae sp. ctiuS14]
MKILRASGGKLNFYFYKATPAQLLIRVSTSRIKDYNDFKETMAILSKELNEPTLPELTTYENIMNSSLDDFTLKEIQDMLLKDIQITDVFFYEDLTLQIHKYPSPSLKYFDPKFTEELTDYFIRNAVV